MRYISGWVVNVYRLLMVRDINYSVGKFYSPPVTGWGNFLWKVILKNEC
nr:MAG TPA: hypothetical protein [Caudoviricetes sp.]